MKNRMKNRMKNVILFFYVECHSVIAIDPYTSRIAN